GGRACRAPLGRLVDHLPSGVRVLADVHHEPGRPTEGILAAAEVVPGRVSRAGSGRSRPRPGPAPEVPGVRGHFEGDGGAIEVTEECDGILAGPGSSPGPCSFEDGPPAVTWSWSSCRWSARPGPGSQSPGAAGRSRCHRGRSPG